MRENQFSTWFSHDEYVGVKCMRTLPCCTRKSPTRWVLAADVVADDMDLLPLALAGDDVGKEGDELLAGVARRGLAQHLAGGGVQRREQAQCAVSLVLESVALGTPWRQRQHPVL